MYLAGFSCRLNPIRARLATQENAVCSHCVPAPVFMFMGIRWFAEGSTPRHSHPVRSAGKTAAASLLPLVLGAAGSGPHQPWARPPSRLHLPPALLSGPGSSLTPAQTIVSQHRPEHSAARRNTYGDGTAVPRPACCPHTPTHCLPLSKPCSHTHSHPLLPTQLFPAAWKCALRLTRRTCSPWGFLVRTHGGGSHAGTRPAHPLCPDLGLQSLHLLLCDTGH